MAEDSSRVVIGNRASGVDIAQVLAALRPGLERALIARLGIEDGTEAAADAVSWALEHEDRVRAMHNPAGYLCRVGQSSARRVRRRRGSMTALIAEPVSSQEPVDVDLQRALMRLKPEQRVAILLVHAHGHTYAEAAQLLGLPVTSVTNHIQRGLVRLRRLMEGK